MTKPVLFVSLEGPVLIPGKNPDPLLEAEIAPYAKPFMHWATQHFDVRWLTDRSPRDAVYVSDKLSLPGHAVPVSTFEDSKIDVIQNHPNFYWVDAELIPHELSWLSQHDNFHRFVQVDPVKGITLEHKEALEKLLHPKR